MHVGCYGGQRQDLTPKPRESLARRGVPFMHVEMPGANHSIADVAMEVDAVVSAFESLGIRYRRRSSG
jgi:hypothetical protein